MYVGVAWIFTAYIMSGSVPLGCLYVFLKRKFLVSQQMASGNRRYEVSIPVVLNLEYEKILRDM
jgi:hypothetical protein